MKSKLKLFILCVLLPGVALFSACQKKNLPEGVILVLLDAARADHFSYAGYPLETTPHIDALARRGIVFSNAYTTATFTAGAVRDFWFGTRLRFPASEMVPLPHIPTNIEKILKKNSISVGLFLSNPFVSPVLGYGRYADHVEYMEWTYQKSPSPHELLQRALIWIKKQSSPFFVYIHLMQPHDPYLPPEEVVQKMYSQLPSLKFGLNDFVRTIVKNDEASKEALTAMKQLYDANLRYADEAIGRFIAGLTSTGFFQKGWFILTADHGEMLGEHGLYHHMESAYDEASRVPLILVPPHSNKSVKPGIVSTLVYWQDIYPTLLDIFQIKDSQSSDFQSLLNVIENPKNGGRHEIFSCSMVWRKYKNGPLLQSCLYRTGKWEAVLFLPSREIELYQFPDTRTFQDNLACLHPSLAQMYISNLETWIQSGEKTSAEKDIRETRERLMSLGYIGTEKTYDFSARPCLLKEKSLQGRISSAQWALLNRNGSILRGLQFDITNLSPHTWPSTWFQKKPFVEFILRKENKTVLKGFLKKDVSPRGKGIVFVPIQQNGVDLLNEFIVYLSVSQLRLEKKIDVLTLEPNIPLEFSYTGFYPEEKNTKTFRWMNRNGTVRIPIPADIRTQCAFLEWESWSFIKTYSVQIALSYSNKPQVFNTRMTIGPKPEKIRFQLKELTGQSKWIEIKLHVDEWGEVPAFRTGSNDYRFLTIAMTPPHIRFNIPCRR